MLLFSNMTANIEEITLRKAHLSVGHMQGFQNYLYMPVLFLTFQIDFIQV